MLNVPYSASKNIKIKLVYYRKIAGGWSPYKSPTEVWNVVVQAQETSCPTAPLFQIHSQQLWRCLKDHRIPIPLPPSFFLRLCLTNTNTIQYKFEEYPSLHPKIHGYETRIICMWIFSQWKKKAAIIRKCSHLKRFFAVAG